MLTYILKMYFVCLIDDILPYAIVTISLIINYCQHFVCVSPNSCCSHLDVTMLYCFHKNYFLYLEQRAVKFLQKKYTKVIVTMKINANDPLKASLSRFIYLFLKCNY